MKSCRRDVVRKSVSTTGPSPMKKRTQHNRTIQRIRTIKKKHATSCNHTGPSDHQTHEVGAIPMHQSSKNELPSTCTHEGLTLKTAQAEYIYWSAQTGGLVRPKRSHSWRWLGPPAPSMWPNHVRESMWPCWAERGADGSKPHENTISILMR